MIRGGCKDDSLAMGRVYCEAWKSAYVGIVPQDFLDALTPEMAAPPAERIAPENCRVYEDGGEVAGLINFVPSGDEGEIRSIYVLPTCWKGGVGRRLFSEACGALREAGCGKVFLWVLTENASARGFYERMGMSPAGEQTITIAGKELSETRYEMKL